MYENDHIDDELPNYLRSNILISRSMKVYVVNVKAFHVELNFSFDINTL